MSVKHRVERLLPRGASNYTTPQKFFNDHIQFFRPVHRPPLDSKTDTWVLGLTSDNLDAVNLQISQVSSAEKWTEHVIKDVIDKLSTDIINAKLPGSGLAGLKEVRSAVNAYLRWAVTGGCPGPGIPLTMEILGREFTIQRLKEAIVEHNAFKAQEKVLAEGAQTLSGHAVE